MFAIELIYKAPIADIEVLTGVDFGPLVDADVLQPVAVRGESAWRPLRTADDIVLG